MAIEMFNDHPQMWAAGDVVRVSNMPEVLRLKANQGPIVRVMSPQMVVVNLGGQDVVVPASNIQLVSRKASPTNNDMYPAGNDIMTSFESKWPLLRAAVKHLYEQEEDVERKKEEPFEQEIAVLFAQKKQVIVSNLQQLQSAWQSAHATGTVQAFVDHMLPDLNKLIAYIERAETDSEVTKAKNQFEQVMELSTAIANDSDVDAWVELQKEQLQKTFI